MFHPGPSYTGTTYTLRLDSTVHVEISNSGREEQALRGLSGESPRNCVKIVQLAQIPKEDFPGRHAFRDVLCPELGPLPEPRHFLASFEASRLPPPLEGPSPEEHRNARIRSLCPSAFARLEISSGRMTWSAADKQSTAVWDGSSLLLFASVMACLVTCTIFP